MTNRTLALPDRSALEPRDLSEARTLATVAVSSKFFAVRSPEEALVVMLTGRDLGLTAMQSLRGIYVVQGKPVVSSDALVAAVLASGVCEYWQPIETSSERCTIETKRKGAPQPVTLSWSLDDAKRAGLLSKQIWQQYPRDMLRHRCAGGLAREVYPDVALGFYVPGEIDDPRSTVVAAPPLDPPAALPEGPEPQLSPVDQVIHTLKYHLGDAGITPLVAAAAWVEHEGVFSADDLEDLFEALLAICPPKTTKAALQHGIVIERLAARCLKIESLESLEFLVIGQYSQRQALPLKARPLWDKEVAKHAERLGCKAPHEWVRAMVDHDEPTPPPGKPQPTPTPALTTISSAAAETERATLDGLRVSLLSKSRDGDPAYALGCAYAKRRSALGRHLAEGRALTIDALLPHCAGDEAQASARLDGICREWDGAAKRARRAA